MLFLYLEDRPFLFPAFRKKISRSANFFVHLNLAATLFVALVVFVFGIELGKITAVSYSY